LISPIPIVCALTCMTISLPTKPASSLASPATSGSTPGVRQEIPFYMRTESLSAGALDDVRVHLIKTLKITESSVDWARPFRVIADHQEGYVTRCLVQFYFDPSLSLSGLRSATLTAIRDVLIAHGAIPAPAQILAPEVSGPSQPR
jgi:hypothetical protein